MMIQINKEVTIVTPYISAVEFDIMAMTQFIQVDLQLRTTENILYFSEDGWYSVKRFGGNMHLRLLIHIHSMELCKLLILEIICCVSLI